jgi:hypothetical protein
MTSMDAHKKWIKDFAAERSRVERDSVGVLNDTENNGNKDSVVDGSNNKTAKPAMTGIKPTTQLMYEARSKLPNHKELVCHLEKPIGWPRVTKDETDNEIISSDGLPLFSLIMQVCQPVLFFIHVISDGLPFFSLIMHFIDHAFM